ncbi:tyrosine-type recombinase/integrase [Gordonia sihwensis]|uniref:Putative integrase n=1 Tax=Gordonia sihwensis NBRC 108236 TaxID=1223544 RepID=L7LL50_9ACTN|nr:tyrosine-type recombinase/integrase [Gordonia sihwensis]GAC61589.1 putative integrase [Gordonia sihwensis NBRC 108236]
MAYIRTHETTVKSKGRAVKRYEVVWRETVRDERGLPVPVDEAKPNGRKRTRARQKSFAARDEAEAYRDELNAEKHRPGGVRTYEDKLFTVAADEWLASRTDLKASTRAEYENQLRPKVRTKRDKDGNSTKHLSIIATFGGKTLAGITRQMIAEWVEAMLAAGKKPSTVRHSYFIVKMVLEQAVVDGLLRDNPADHVKLPSERTAESGTPGVVDDPDSFLTAAQVTVLEAALPWPFNVLAHTAVWSGLRAAELAGLQVGDVLLPQRQVNPNARPKPAQLNVHRTLRVTPDGDVYDTPKTRGSRRTVPLPPATAQVLRDYLARHPRRDEPTAPLFPAMRLIPGKPTGVKNTAAGTPNQRQASALAALSVTEAAERIELDWKLAHRHGNFYKAVFRPAVLRANRLAAEQRAANDSPFAGEPITLPEGLKFHSLRHSYASLCVAAGIPPLEIARFMGHAKVTTTLSVYAHLFEDDHTDAMDALAGMGAPATGDNVVALRI